MALAGVELAHMESGGKEAPTPRGQDRGRRSSWEGLPQHLRGIRLKELFDLCDDHRSWLEDLRWRCGGCHRSCGCGSCCGGGGSRRRLVRENTNNVLRWNSEEADHGPCPSCGFTEGALQMRNLYEVNAEIIKPFCEGARTSYVELLRITEAGSRADFGGDSQIRGAPVDTFVSHWWGEEFPMMVRTLKKYAKWRCDRHVSRQRKFEGWSFWICAFANNQFAVEHATGLEGDVSTSAFAVALQNCQEMVAVIDPEAMIYKRIWCTFELFYAAKLPHKPKISLANAGGVFSAGAATRATVVQMHELLSTVRVADAQATVQADRAMIMSALAAAGVGTQQLDRLLRAQVQEGLRMVCLRAKLFSQLSCHFLCGMTVSLLLGTLQKQRAWGFVAEWSWYLEWAILLHIPVVCGFCVLCVFLCVLAFSGETGRNLAVDWMWLFGGMGKAMLRAVTRQDPFVKAVGAWAVLNSLVAMGMCSLAEWRSSRRPQAGILHAPPAIMLAIILAVLSLETFILDIRLSPKRFRRRLASIELVAISAGVAAGLVALGSTGKMVLLMFFASWIFAVFGAFLRDHVTPRVRRRIEEPFWS